MGRKSFEIGYMSFSLWRVISLLGRGYRHSSFYPLVPEIIDCSRERKLALSRTKYYIHLHKQTPG